MPSSDFERLLSEYLDGELNADDRGQLAKRLETDHSRAREFDEALRIEALLIAAHREPAAAERAPRPVRHQRWLVPAFAAAALLAALTGGLLAWRGRADNEVLSGRLLSDGTEVRQVANGARVEAAGDRPAMVRLADGSRAELAPGSRAVLHGPVGDLRQVVELESGRSSFNVEKGAKQFRVDTPPGSVTVTGTEFSVELRPQGDEGGEAMSRKLAMVLVVAVTTGSVSVDFEGRKTPLLAGQEQAFGAEGERESSLPEGVRGFSGQVRGVVVAKGDKNTFTFKVARVLRVWDGNKAKKPEALVGQTIKVGPRWVKNDRGKWHPVELQVKFIRTLEAGQEMTLEVRNVEGDHFNILELSAEQREAAEGGEGEREGGGDREGEGPREGEGDRDKEGKHEGDGDREGEGAREGERESSLPEGVHGFSGQVRGVVVAKGDKNTFSFKVARVLRVWDGNKAKKPEALVGQTVTVGPRWAKNDRGKWHPVERQVKFIRTLEAGQEMTLEIRNLEGDHFNILELSAEQRELAERGGGEREGPRDGDGGRKREGDREADPEPEGGDTF